MTPLYPGLVILVLIFQFCCTQTPTSVILNSSHLDFLTAFRFEGQEVRFQNSRKFPGEDKESQPQIKFRKRQESRKADVLRGGLTSMLGIIEDVVAQESMARKMTVERIFSSYSDEEAMKSEKKLQQKDSTIKSSNFHNVFTSELKWKPRKSGSVFAKLSLEMSMLLLPTWWIQSGESAVKISY